MFSDMKYSSKIITGSDFLKMREGFRQQEKKVVHCHGVFDLLHPGHISHLEEAKNLGNILVVTVTSKPYVNKGPGRPYFSDEIRLKTLAALSCVDYVVLSEDVTAMKILEYIQPDYYVKGREFENYEEDVTQNIDKEVAKVRCFGGDVYFTDDKIVFSSTKLLNNNFDVLPPGVKEYSQNLATKYSFKEVRKLVDDFQKLKVMVIGDIVIDEYVFCSVVGLMSKDRGFSAKYLNEERYLGGSLAVANHLSSFINNVTVCGIMGEELHLHSRILNDLSKNMLLDLEFNKDFSTIIKRRYVEKRGARNEYDKLFSINYLGDESNADKIDKKAFYHKLDSSISSYDMVIVTDYGHGLIDQTAMDIIQDKARFLAVNCQTNSTNYGTNIITKYKHANTFTLDERELGLAFNTNSKNYNQLLTKLIEQFNSSVGWLTLGSLGALSIDKNGQSATCPAFTLTVQDTVGAGDAFYALSSICAKEELPKELGTLFGNIAGALAANVLGNSKPVGKVDFLKFASTILNV
jgi:rfaE bifunctional protein nucleotidyltransferase chain/domain